MFWWKFFWVASLILTRFQSVKIYYISNTQKVLDKIREFNHQTRVHSFGIGSGASAFLVKEIAKEGKGTSTFFLQVHIERQINFILAKHAFQYPESMIFSGLISLCMYPWPWMW